MGFDEAMVDAVGGTAGLVEDVLAGGRALAGGAKRSVNSLPLSVSTLRRTNGALARKRSEAGGGVRRLSGRISK